MAQFAIGPFLIPLGTTNFGPFNVPASWRRLSFTLDGAAQVAPMLLVLEYAADGVNFAEVARADYTGPALDDAGHLVTAIDLQVVLGTPAPGSTPAIRGRLENAAAFLTSGGLLEVL